jgi:ribosomal protein S18 acetylase RimI-like enzyme
VIDQGFEIDHVEQLSGSYAHFPAVKAWVEIVDAGLGDGGVMSINWDDSATVMKLGGEIVGLIVWRYAKWTRDAWICVGWVKGSHRRKGIYRELYLATREKAKAAGALSISGGVNPNNHAVRSTAAAFGRKEYGVTLREEIV